MSDWKDFNTTATLFGGGIVIVGEEHGNEFSGSLGARVLEDVEPATTAIEMPPGRSPRNAAMGEVVSYSKLNEVPRANIDEDRTRMIRSTDQYASLIRDSNKFTSPVREDGDLPRYVAEDARDRIFEEYGTDTYEEMYVRREIMMARRLRWLAENYDTPIVAAVGAFHVDALSNALESGGISEPVGDDRIHS